MSGSEPPDPEGSKRKAGTSPEGSAVRQKRATPSPADQDAALEERRRELAEVYAAYDALYRASLLRQRQEKAAAGGDGDSSSDEDWLLGPRAAREPVAAEEEEASFLRLVQAGTKGELACAACLACWPANYGLIAEATDGKGPFFHLKVDRSNSSNKGCRPVWLHTWVTFGSCPSLVRRRLRRLSPHCSAVCAALRMPLPTTQRPSRRSADRPGLALAVRCVLRACALACVCISVSLLLMLCWAPAWLAGCTSRCSAW